MRKIAEIKNDIVKLRGEWNQRRMEIDADSKLTATGRKVAFSREFHAVNAKREKLLEELDATRAVRRSEFFRAAFLPAPKVGASPTELAAERAAFTSMVRSLSGLKGGDAIRKEIARASRSGDELTLLALMNVAHESGSSALLELAADALPRRAEALQTYQEFEAAEGNAQSAQLKIQDRMIAARLPGWEQAGAPPQSDSQPNNAA